MAVPAVIDIESAIEAKSDEELRAEYSWLCAIIERNSHGTNGTATINGDPKYSWETRMTGNYAESLILYVMTGVLRTPTQAVYHSDLTPMMNIYKIAPPHVKEILAPVIANYKAEANKAPDLHPHEFWD